MKNHRTLLSWLAALFTSATTVTLPAQTSVETTTNPETAPAYPPPTPLAAQTPDQIVQMSRFIVRTTQGMGYVDANSASSFKTNQKLLDIPQGVLVLTNDLLTDIAATRSSDILQYVGVQDLFRGEVLIIRGISYSYPFIDDLPDTVPYEDSVFVDSIELIKGPAEVLYIASGLGGVILKTTKKPLQHQQDIVTLTADSLGMFRSTIDFTGPIGALGTNLKFSYRLVAAYQSGGQYFANSDWDLDAVHPTVEIDYNQTTVIIAYDFQKLHAPSNGEGVLTPTGNLFTGAGYKYAGGLFPNQMEADEREGVRFSVLQKISDTWEMKLSASLWRFHRYGGVAVNTSVNYVTNTIGGILRENNQSFNNAYVQDDFNGKYNLGIFNNQSTFGFNFADTVNISKFWTTVNDGPNSYLIPMGSAAAIDAVHVPQQSAGEYNVPANPGSRAVNIISNIYYQHQIDVIPNWLTLVAGWTFSNSEAVTNTNIAFNTPYASTDINGGAWLHRLGAILHLSQELSLYALNSTTYSVSSAVDYNDNRLPNSLGTDNELGFKTALWGGRLTSTISVFDMKLNNQDLLQPGVNPFGVGYYIPIGSVTSRGWEGELALAPLPGLQIIATGYRANIVDQDNGPVNWTFGDSWSLFTRYDFAKASPLDGLSVGGGLSRLGDRIQSTGGLTFPTGWASPAFFKLKEGTPVMAFINYRFNQALEARLNGSNLLNQKIPLGAQTTQVVDPDPPLAISLTIDYKF